MSTPRNSPKDEFGPRHFLIRVFPRMMAGGMLFVLLSIGATSASPSVENTLSLPPSGFGPIHMSLLLMLIGDPSLSSNTPQWWNASPIGCIFIGLHPRGAWQIFQRSVQWGDGLLSKAFGVVCKKPHLYAYFACTIRNRVEVWDSVDIVSPMEGSQESDSWNSTIRRPTKLLQGSFGGIAFMANILRPKEGEQYGIASQAKFQFQSILLAAAAQMKSGSDFQTILARDLGISDRLSPTFAVLSKFLVSLSFVALLLLGWIAHISSDNSIGMVLQLPLILEISSLLCWMGGAIGLLMMGGTPSVKIVRKELPFHVESRLQKPAAEENIRIEFGSLYGSLFVMDRGYAMIPSALVREICQLDVQLLRPFKWYLQFGWFSCLIVISIILKVIELLNFKGPAGWIGIVALVIGGVCRSWGIMGPEEWMIPNAFHRRDTQYGAPLVGQIS